MKRMLAIFLTLLALCGCHSGVTDTAVVELGASQRFSQEELSAASDALAAYFRGNFYDCTMERIWYDEELSTRETVSYLNSLGIADVTAENLVQLEGTFTTAGHPKTGLSSDATYYYHFLLIRDDADSPWRVVPEASGQG